MEKILTPFRIIFKMVSLSTVIWDFDITNYFIYPYFHSNFLAIQLLKQDRTGKTRALNKPLDWQIVERSSSRLTCFWVKKNVSRFEPSSLDENFSITFKPRRKFQTYSPKFGKFVSFWVQMHIFYFFYLAFNCLFNPIGDNNTFDFF